MKSHEIVALAFPEVLEFVEDKQDNGEEFFSLAEAEELHAELDTDYHVSVVVRALKEWGLKQDPRDGIKRKIQAKAFNAPGFSKNRHTRWQECPSHGGSGLAGGVWTGAGRASHTPG